MERPQSVPAGPSLKLTNDGRPGEGIPESICYVRSSLKGRALPVAIQPCGEIRDVAKTEPGVSEDELSQVHPWRVDVTNTDHVSDVIDAIANKFDVLVCAAGTPLAKFVLMRRYLREHTGIGISDR